MGRRPMQVSVGRFQAAAPASCAQAGVNGPAPLRLHLLKGK